MPELPEIETIARQLAPRLTGLKIRALTVLDPKLRRPRPPALTGRKILSVGRAGKQLAIELSAFPGEATPLWLGIHLRMTGRLQYQPRPPAVDKHLRAIFTLNRGCLLFYDTRRFGVFSFRRSRAALLPPGVLDPASPEFTAARLAALLRRAVQPIKPWLLRQDRLVGLGNYLASEILFAAGLDPHRRGQRLTAAEVVRLHAATLSLLQQAIACNGTTLSDYADAHGRRGAFQDFLRVYGRAGQPCRACSATIRRTVQAGRSTFFCPVCQRRGAIAKNRRRPAGPAKQRRIAHERKNRTNHLPRQSSDPARA